MPNLAPARLIPFFHYIFKPTALLIYFLLLFIVFLFPTRSLNYEAGEVAGKRLVNYEAFYQEEKTGQGKIYSWLRPETKIYFNDLPRYAPLKIELELNFDRPAGFEPGSLEISEVREGEPPLPMALFKGEPARPGFQTCTFTAPPCPKCETGLTLNLKSNAFKPNGETRTLGVVVGNFGAKLGFGHYRYLLWPQPYFFAVLLVGLLLSLWITQSGASYPVGILWAFPFALSLAIFSPSLINQSWLILIGAGLAAVALIPQLRIPKIISLEVTCLLLILIFALIPLSFTDIKDLQLYQNWLKDLQVNGPFNIYNYSPFLDYLPLLLYLLWFYRLVSALFGLAMDPLALKLFFSIPILINLWLLYRVTRNSNQLPAPAEIEPGQDKEIQKAPLSNPAFPALLVTGLSSTLIFNAAGWGQTDTLSVCLLLWTLLAIQWGRPLTAGALLGLDVALKPQGWVVIPLLALFILKGYGWKKTLLSGGLAFALLFGLCAPAFGFDFNSFRHFLFQPAFAGELNLGSVNAYNWLYLLGFGTREAPSYIALGGVLIIFLVYLGIILGGWGPKIWRAGNSYSKGRSLQALGAGLVLLIFFLGAIKMRERYLEYGLLFMGLAAIYYAFKGKNTNFWLLAFLALEIFSMLNLLPVFVVHRNDHNLETVYLWRDLLLANWFPAGIAIGNTLIFGYFLGQFLIICRQRWIKKVGD